MATEYTQQYVYTSSGVDYNFSIEVLMRTGSDPATGLPTNSIKVIHNDASEDDYADILDSDVIRMVQFYYQLEIDSIDSVPNRDLDRDLQAQGFTANYNA